MSDFSDIRLQVPEQAGGVRLDTFLAEQTSFSRRRLRRAIDEGGIYINKKRCRKAGQQLKGGESLRIVILENETLTPFQPDQLLWQQNGLYLIHKRSGQYSQEALHRSMGTLPHELASYLAMKPAEAKQLRPVHRLDRGTSGLLLLSSNPKLLQHLQAHWQQQVSKSYLAVVEPAPKWNTQHIELAIGKSRDEAGRYHIEKTGRPCLTDAEVIEHRGYRALLKLVPHTGRTHQLRIHLAALGCPILGDTRYGGKKHSRLMLHAHTLCVQPPALSTTHEWKTDPEEDWIW